MKWGDWSALFTQLTWGLLKLSDLKHPKFSPGLRAAPKRTSEILPRSSVETPDSEQRDPAQDLLDLMLSTHKLSSTMALRGRDTQAQPQWLSRVKSDREIRFGNEKFSPRARGCFSASLSLGSSQ